MQSSSHSLAQHAVKWPVLEHLLHRLKASALSAVFSLAALLLAFCCWNSSCLAQGSVSWGLQDCEVTLGRAFSLCVPQSMWTWGTCVCLSVCVYVYRHMCEGRDCHWMSSLIALFLILWGRVSHLNAKLTNSDSLVSQLVLRNPFFTSQMPSLQVGHHAHTAFMLVVEIQTLLLVVSKPTTSGLLETTVLSSAVTPCWN